MVIDKESAAARAWARVKPVARIMLVARWFFVRCPSRRNPRRRRSAFRRFRLTIPGTRPRAIRAPSRSTSRELRINPAAGCAPRRITRTCVSAAPLNCHNPLQARRAVSARCIHYGGNEPLCRPSRSHRSKPCFGENEHSIDNRANETSTTNALGDPSRAHPTARHDQGSVDESARPNRHPRGQR